MITRIQSHAFNQLEPEPDEESSLSLSSPNMFIPSESLTSSFGASLTSSTTSSTSSLSSPASPPAPPPDPPPNETVYTDDIPDLMT